MKTTMTLKSIALIALFGAALSSPAWAQPGPGMGGGMGPGMGMGMQNAGPGPGMGPGAGMGPGGGHGMRFNRNNTRGWTLMTPEERTAFQIKMREVKTFDECKVVQTEHRSLMETRAKDKGVTLPTPRRNACENMKERGIIK
ncbi:MAG: hypothetical protein WCK63_04990 [Betaproteobacteria bacterium]